MTEVIKNIILILTPKEKRKFWKLILFDVFISALDILFLIVLLFVINFYTLSHTAKPSVPGNMLEKYPLLLIIVFFVLFSIKNLFGFLVVRMQYRFTYEVASRLSVNKLLQYLQGNYKDFVNIDSAVYTRKISQQPIEFSHYVLRGLQQIISQSILIIFTMIAIASYNIILFPLLFLILIPPLVLLAVIMKKQLSTIRSSAKSTSEKSIQHLNEALSGYVEINIYDKKDFFITRFNKYQRKLHSFLSQQQIIQNLPSRLIEVFAIFGLLMLVLINSYYSDSKTITVVTLGAFMAAAYKIIPGIVKIFNSSSHIKSYSYSIADLLKAINRKREGTGESHEIHSCEFKNICFAYDDRDIINNFSLKLNRGDFVCITGKSGRGKTTLINILLGFLTADSGEILVNHIANPQSNEYWGRTSYIKQQPFLIHDSILKNITLEEGEYDRKRFAEAVSAAGIVKAINKSGDDFDTIIAEDGKNISGGQRQRIILARALYKDFDMLILDEPFSELDTGTEVQLLKYLKKISEEGKIILLLSHSEAGLSFCNKEIKLDD